MSERVEKLRSDFANYGKTSGYILADELGLSVSQTTHAVTSEDDINIIVDKLSSPKLTCRPDAPLGKGNFLPRGRDLAPSKISQFLDEVRLVREDAILLISLPPSIEVTGRYIPRYEVTGGAMAIIDQGKKIYIDFVGEGFDVGEITRGKEIHSAVSIPWEHIEGKPFDIMRHIHMGIYGGHYRISDQDYSISRERRIEELRKKLGETEENLDNKIPTKPKHLSPALFRTIFQPCIQNIMCAQDKRLGSTFGVMMNLYDNKPYVFELWQPKRSALTC